LKAIIFDTETTDAKDPEIIEAAWIAPDGSGEYCERFLPTKDISLGAMATHHIILSDLTGCRKSAEFAFPTVEFLIGHNVDFDWRAVGSPAVKRICTLALSRWLFPEIDSHSQTAMMYHLFPKDQARDLCQNAHNALSDVKVCLMLFQSLVDEMRRRNIPAATWDEIYQASETARIPTVMTFGKHKGMAIKDVPPDYKRWLLGQTDIDEYLVIALKGVARG
jgi:exodeoxyribonuclease X